MVVEGVCENTGVDASSRLELLGLAGEKVNDAGAN